MNKTKIEWTDRTWNPVVGCKNNCFYCYAKRRNDRFKGIPKWNEPKFYPERLRKPYERKKPTKIFVGSMCELFGDWIPKEWIEQVIKVVEENPQHTFQFLTKNPKRYLEFNFPKNCWLGATVESGETPIMRRRLWEILFVKERYPDLFVFVSVEPLLGKFFPDDFRGLDLVIVGAMTGSNAISPKKEWIESIKRQNIFYKNNIKKFLTP